MEIEKIKINKLKIANYNPRKDLVPGDPEYDKIKKSIEEFGYVDPIIVNKDMTVIGGHQRLKVLEELGYSEIECVIVDVDKNKEKALNIALNKISGIWDSEKLENLLKELNETDIDITLTGYDLQDIEHMLNTDNIDVNNFFVEAEDKEEKKKEIKCPHCGMYFEP